MKTVILHSIFLLFSAITLAQDPQFSQVFAVPLYLGPSFAGATGGTRVATNFRDQWPALKNEFISYSLAFDYFFKNTNSGIGLAVIQDHSGAGLLSSTNCLLQYSYVFNLTKDLQLRPGIEASYNVHSLSYNKVVFGDQLSFDGTLPSSTVETSLAKKISYIDFASSILLFHSKYWLGISAHHLSKPNQSLTNEKSVIPLKITFYGGKKIKLNTAMAKRQKENLYLAFEYKQQAKFSQCLFGSYVDYIDMTFGIWYRGLPKHTYQSYFNSDAIVLAIAYRFSQFKIGYSYDITTSRLAINSAGSHEISIVYLTAPRSKPKFKMIPCPTEQLDIYK